MKFFGWYATRCGEAIKADGSSGWCPVSNRYFEFDKAGDAFERPENYAGGPLVRNEGWDLMEFFRGMTTSLVTQ